MKPKYDAIVKSESQKNGLVILSATMGEMSMISMDEATSNPSIDVVDVKIPLQFLVRNSKLQVKAGSKVCF